MTRIKKIDRDVQREFAHRAEQRFVSQTQDDKSDEGFKVAEKEKDEDQAYFLHRIGTQLFAGLFKSASIAYRGTAHYRFYFSDYHQNPSADIYKDPLSFIYEPGNRASNALSSLLPKDLKGVTAEDVKAGEMYGKEKFWGKISNVIEVFTNLTSLYLCLTSEKKVDLQQATTYFFRSLSAGAYFIAIHNQGTGSKLADNPAHYLKAYGYLRFARWSFMAMNITQTIGGLAKLGIETKNVLSSSEKVNPSAVVEGAIQTGLGTSWIFLNSFLLRESAEAASTTGEMGKAVNILKAQRIPLTFGIKWGARITGLAGAVASGYMSGSNMYLGIFDNSIPEDEKEKRLVSGSLGMASAVSFAGYAFLINPATLPIGTLCFASSLGFMSAQTIYDEWDNGVSYVYDEMINEMVDVYEGIEEFEYIPARNFILDTADATAEIHGYMADEMTGIYANADKNIVKPLGKFASDVAYAAVMGYAEMADEMTGILANITPAP